MTVRIGILGAAHVAPMAIVRPAATNEGAEVVAIAARSRPRADAFASEHGIEHVAPTYDALVERDDLDAVYVALPASEHRRWAGRAMQLGKHVLCEKPLACTASEARDLVDIATQTGRVLLEAYHYRHHPYMRRIVEIVRSGGLGAIERIEAAHHNRVPTSWPVYWDAALGGGSTLHTGCYPVHCVRSLVGGRPIVTAADAGWFDGVDAWLSARLRFDSGVAASVSSSMSWDGPAENWVEVVGTDATLRATNFIVPHFGEHIPRLEAVLEVRTPRGTHRERFGSPSTYEFQLRAFVDAVEGSGDRRASHVDMVENAAVLEAMVEAARRRSGRRDEEIA